MMTIAIDGPSGAGKSTVAKSLASELDIMYLDTGAMYRALGLLAIRRGVAFNDEERIVKMLRAADIAITYRNDEQHVWLDGEDVSRAIRQNEVSRAASDVSAIGAVREEMVRMQQAVARGKSVVMDGRDICSYVLPMANHKFFLTASLEERARRRMAELAAKGERQPYEKVFEEMKQRDDNDSTRVHSPLKQAPDAELIDSTGMDADQVVALIKSKIDGETSVL